MMNGELNLENSAERSKRRRRGGRYRTEEAAEDGPTMNEVVSTKYRKYLQLTGAALAILSNQSL
jgi:hypothetical protein